MDGSPPGGCRQWRLRWRGLRCSFCEVRVPLYLVRKVGRFVHPVCLVWAGGGGALFALGGFSSSPGFVSPAADSPVLSGCLGLSLAGRCGLAAGLLLLVGGGFGCCSPGWCPLLVAALVMAVASWLAVVRSGNGEGGIVGSGDDLVRSAHPHHRRGWGGLDAWKAEDRWAGVVWPAPAPEKRGVCP
ncbi:hypothetical protein PVAP13_4NG221744 [Panicum virgatum]|uniref:Uncharacterized protein n=1 Tax=Panicum virgatum TaxID=38727 RepID=A0A8T0TCC8_PANVG|nr:hypothetical protein PVAP13_4NG221744 [Panicum virgatum]